MATGAAHAYFGHPEWESRAPGLKTLDDALEIRRQVLLAFEAAEREPDPVAQTRLLTFVIVGGGPTGVELAGALAEIARRTLNRDFRSIRPESARILMLEGGPSVLPTFPEPLRKAARVAGTPRCGRENECDGHRNRCRRRAGPVEPQSRPRPSCGLPELLYLPLVRSLGAPLDRAGRVLAEPTLAVPGHPEIFVVGDVCALSQDGKPLPGVAQVAKQGGAHAAENVVRAVQGQPPLPFHYRNYGNMATIGRGAAVADLAFLKVSGFLAWLLWLFVHIFWLIGFRNRLAVIGEWAWAYVTFQRRARLITGERLLAGKGILTL